MTVISSPPAAHSAEAELEDLFCTLHRQFDHETESADVVQSVHSIASRQLRVRICGRRLAETLLPAWAHVHTVPSTAPEVSIDAWCGPLDGRLIDSLVRLANAFRPTPTVRAGTFRLFVQGNLESVYLYDARNRHALYWAPSFERVPAYVRAAPFRPVLHWVLSSPSVQLVHAAAVATISGAVLLPGKGGSGKSTVALSCWRAGMTYLGDDYVGLELRAAPVAWSLYCSAKLRHDHARRLLVDTPLTDYDGERAIVFLTDVESTSAEARAILVPRIVDSDMSAIEPCSPAAGLRALAPSSMFQLPGAGQETFQLLAALVKRLPSFVLHVGRSADGVADTVRELLCAL